MHALRNFPRFTRKRGALRKRRVPHTRLRIISEREQRVRT